MQIEWPDNIHARRYLYALGEMLNELEMLKDPRVHAVLGRYERTVFPIDINGLRRVNLTLPADVEENLPPELKVA